MSETNQIEGCTKPQNDRMDYRYDSWNILLPSHQSEKTPMRLKSYIAALVFLIGSTCFAQNTLFQSDVRSTPGPVVPGALVTVCVSTASTLTTPCFPKANIYLNAADTGPSTAQNPITADGNGNYSFFAVAGTYVISVTGRGLPGRTYTVMIPCGPLSVTAGCAAGANILPLSNTWTGTNNFTD